MKVAVGCSIIIFFNDGVLLCLCISCFLLSDMGDMPCSWVNWRFFLALTTCTYEFRALFLFFHHN